MARHAADDDTVDELKAVTVTWWMKPQGQLQGYARLVMNWTNNVGFLIQNNQDVVGRVMVYSADGFVSISGATKR